MPSHPRLPLARIITALALAGFPLTAAFAVDYNFLPVSGTANWNDGASWTTLPTDDATFPNAAGDFANLIKDFTGNAIINLQQGITVGRLDIGDNSSTQTVVLQSGTGTQAVTFDAASGNAKLNVATAGTGAITFNYNTVLADNLDITNGSHSVNWSNGNTIALGTNTLTLLGTGAASLNVGTSSANVPITGAGNVVVNSSATSGAAMALFGTSTFTGGLTLQNGLLVIGTSSTGGVDAAVTNGGFGTGTLTIQGATAAATSRIIRATSSGNRVIGNSVAANSDFTIGQSSTSQTTTFAGTMTLAGNRVIGAEGGSNGHSITGAIIDGGNGFALNKAGGGGLVLSGTSTYSGVTTVDNGTLLVGASVSPGAAGPLGNATSAVVVGTAASNASLLTNGAFNVGRDIAVGGTGGTQTIGGNTNDNSAFTGNLTLNRAAVLTSVALGANATTFSGQISGGFGVTKAGAGTVVLTNGANNFTGPVALSNGTLRLAAAGAEGASNVTFTNTTGANTATLQLGDAFAYSKPITITAGSLGATTLGATNASGTTATYASNVTLAKIVTLTNATAGAMTQFTGVIDDGAGTFGVIVNGPGTVEFAGLAANAYNGLTTVSLGTLLLNSAAAGGAIPGDANTATADVLINGGTLRFGANDQLAADTIIQFTSGTLDLAGQTQTIFDLDYTGGAILGAGGLTITNGTDLFLFDGTAVTTPTVLGRKLIYAGQTTAATVTGNLQLGSDPAHEFAINDGTAPVDVNVSGVISNETTASTITKRGAGVLKLSSASGNTFGGAGRTVMIEGGAVAVTEDNQLGHAANSITFAGGALRFDSAFATARQMNVTASGGGIEVATGVTAAISAAGQIAGTGTLVKSGAGTLAITADQSASFVGSTTLAGGTLRISAENQLGAATNDVAFQGGTLQVTSGFATDAGKVFTLGAGGGTLSIDPGETLAIPSLGGLAGSSVLIKTGSGKLVLGGANASLIAGAGVNVAEGSLELQNAGALGTTPKAAVTLSGGRLALANDTATAFGNAVAVTADSFVLSDVLTPGGAGVTQTLGALTLGAATLTAETGTNVTGGAPAVIFTGTTLTGNATLATAGATALSTGGIALGANKLTLTGSGTTNLNGVISGGPGAGQVAIEKNGAGTVISSTAASTFIGDLVINDGVYRLAGATALGNAGNVLRLAGGTLQSSAGANVYALQFSGGSVRATGAARDFNGVTSATPSITFSADTTFNLEDPLVPGTARDINFGLNAGTSGVTASTVPVSLVVNAPASNATSQNKLRFRQSATAGSVTGTITVNPAAIAQFRGAGAVNGFGSGTEIRLNTGFNAGSALNSGRFEFVSDTDTTFGNNVTLLGDSAIGVGRVNTGNDNKIMTVGNLTIGSQTLATVDVSSVPASNDKLVFSGTTTFTGSPTFLTQSADLTLNAIIESGGIFDLTKSGARTLTLNAPGYTGATTLAAGTLITGAPNVLSDGPLLVSGGTLNLHSSFDTVGPLTITGGTITGGGFLSTSGVTAQNGTINVALSGTGGLAKAGAGAVTLGAANTFLGDVTVTDGTLGLGIDEALPDGANVTVNGGTLNFASTAAPATNRTETIANLTVNGGFVRTALGTPTGPSRITVNGTLNYTGGDFQINSGSSLQANKVIFGGNQVNLLVLGGNSAAQVNELLIGPGGLEFTGTNLRMNIGSGSALGSRVVLGGDVTSFASANEAGIFGESAGGSVGVREIAFGAEARTFTVADGEALNDLRIAFAITGSGGLVKQGPGRLALTGTSPAFTGPATVNAGTLAISGGLGGSAATVNGGTLLVNAGGLLGPVTVAGGTLGGSGGTVGAVSATSGAVAPGTSAGMLNTGDFSLGSGADFLPEIGGLFPGAEYDQLNVTGGVTLAGDLQGSLLNGFLPQVGDTFFLILNDGTDPVVGTFAGLAQGSTVSFGGVDWTVTYSADGDAGGSANDVALIAQIPEPSAAALLLGGSGALLGLRRRRARR